MRHISVFKLLLTVSFLKTVNAINACPVADTVYTGIGGIRYRICLDTDLTGGSNSVTANIATVTACAQLCDQSIGCFKAVYDTQTKDCHFKALAGLNWVADARFDVVQMEQVNIARCPYAETTYTNNNVSILCLEFRRTAGFNVTPPGRKCADPQRSDDFKRLRAELLNYHDLRTGRFRLNRLSMPYQSRR
jgi:hypothetical protein